MLHLSGPKRAAGLLFRLFPALLSSVLLVGAGAVGTATHAQTTNGVTTVALYNITPSRFFLRNSNTPGEADSVFQYGPSTTSFSCGVPPPYYCSTGWYPVAGDWNGDGTDTIGVYNSGAGLFALRNSNMTGGADITFRYGPDFVTPYFVPLVGDWDGL